MGIQNNTRLAKPGIFVTNPYLQYFYRNQLLLWLNFNL
jgi:hypothetical protein